MAGASGGGIMDADSNCGSGTSAGPAILGRMSPMTRTRSLFGKRRFQLLGSLAAVLVAASVVYGSGANFTSTSANASNVFSGGNLQMSNGTNGAVLSVARMVPAEVRNGSVTIANTGDVAGQFYLEPVTMSDVTAGFGTKLQLQIDEDNNGTTTTIYQGSLDGLTQLDRGIWQPGDQRTYTFTLTFPDAGKGADNSYKGATATAQFDWTAISVADATN